MVFGCRRTVVALKPRGAEGLGLEVSIPVIDEYVDHLGVDYSLLVSVSGGASHNSTFNARATHRGSGSPVFPLAGSPFNEDEGSPHFLRNKLNLLLISGGSFLSLTPFHSKG